MHDKVRIKADAPEAKAGTIGHIVMIEPAHNVAMIEIEPRNRLTDDLLVFDIALDNLELVEKASPALAM